MNITYLTGTCGGMHSPQVSH